MNRHTSLESSKNNIAIKYFNISIYDSFKHYKYVMFLIPVFKGLCIQNIFFKRYKMYKQSYNVAFTFYNSIFVSTEKYNPLFWLSPLIKIN